jgi:hypothetical protein
LAQSADSLHRWQAKWQWSAWLQGSASQAPHLLGGTRLIPSLEWASPAKRWRWEAEAAAVWQAQAQAWPFEAGAARQSLQPYRLWLRASGKQWSLRAGLQKIDFGASILLRPLRWFDQIDPRDPLQITRGVYGVLARYTWLNNANAWAWGLYGNDLPKGWEAFGTARRRPEGGGRLQLPVPKGEVALSGHWRSAALPGGPRPERRVGFDAKWDVGPGLWLEASYQWMGQGPPQRQLLALAGIDYTFGLGNGLGMAAEHLTARTPLGTAHFTALQASYPIDFFHRAALLLYADWHGGLYRFAYLQYDAPKASWFLMGYWNPTQPGGVQPGTLAYSGAGLQLMWVWNHGIHRKHGR